MWANFRCFRGDSTDPLLMMQFLLLSNVWRKEKKHHYKRITATLEAACIAGGYNHWGWRGTRQCCHEIWLGFKISLKGCSNFKLLWATMTSMKNKRKQSCKWCIMIFSPIIQTRRPNLRKYHRLRKNVLP